MKRLVTLVLVPWLFTSTLAQDSKTKQETQKPNFSGTWVGNNSSTDTKPARDPHGNAPNDPQNHLSESET